MLNQIIKRESLEYIHELTKELSLMGCDGGKYGFRVSGSTGEQNVSKRIAEEMKAIGLSNVTTEHFPVHSWEFLDGSLEIDGVEIPMSSYCGIKGTEKDGIFSEIIDVGNGTAENYIGRDVKGKVVFCTFDILEDYWISMPVYEAEVHGAAGVIISYTGDFYGTREDAINCFDSQCEYSIPVGNISRKNGKFLREKIQNSSVYGRFRLHINVDFNGLSSNVIGYIPGEESGKMMMLAGHMDGYFHSYQDDLLGIGIIMGIAKAMIECGYKPKHTLAFVAHGSEEYGETGSRYDWCIGSWYNINKIHPEWSGKMIAFFNIDAIRPGTPVYNIASTPEYHEFFSKLMENMEVPASSWPEGKALLGLNGPWSDDYNYAIKGVPGIICGRGPAEWSYQNYHTQFDSYEIYEEEKEIIQYVAKHYTEMVYAFDECVLPPFSYNCAFDGFIDTLDDYLDEDKATINGLKKTVVAVIDESKALYEKIKAVNESKNIVMNSDVASAERKKLLQIYKLIQGDLKKLSPWDDVVFGHDLIIANMKAIESAIGKSEFTEIIEAMWEVDLFKIAYQFDKKTYAWLMHCQDETRNDIFWGAGKTQKYINFEHLIDALKKEDIKATKLELEKIWEFEKLVLEDMLEYEYRILKEILNQIKAVKIS